MSTFKERLAIAAALLAMAGQQGWAQQAVPPASTAGAPAVPTIAGHFDALSAAGQKTARRLFRAQQVTAEGAAPLSLDQIAALKGKTGWNGVLKEMRGHGLVAARSLDALTSAEPRPRGKGGRLVTVTHGSGSSSAVGSISARPDTEKADLPPLRSP
jgi:hypothetical protein